MKQPKWSQKINQQAKEIERESYELMIKLESMGVNPGVFIPMPKPEVKQTKAA